MCVNIRTYSRGESLGTRLIECCVLHVHALICLDVSTYIVGPDMEQRQYTQYSSNFYNVTVFEV